MLEQMLTTARMFAKVVRKYEEACLAIFSIHVEAWISHSLEYLSGPVRAGPQGA
jgi:hypothetical protein